MLIVEENTKELARFAKNYLPILFNIYTACEEMNDSVSLPILQTLKCYLQIADQQVRSFNIYHDMGSTVVGNVRFLEQGDAYCL